MLLGLFPDLGVVGRFGLARVGLLGRLPFGFGRRLGLCLRLDFCRRFGRRRGLRRRRRFGCRSRLTQALHVLGPRALGALGHVELDCFTFRERLKAFALDGRVVDEHVRPVVLFNETKTLLIIEPLHFSCSHWFCPLCSSVMVQRELDFRPLPLSN